jgi:hypothetical protein
MHLPLESKVVTTIAIPRNIWRLLRALAEQRAVVDGGRASVSGIVVSLAVAEAARQKKAPRA